MATRGLRFEIIPHSDTEYQSKLLLSNIWDWCGDRWAFLSRECSTGDRISCYLEAILITLQGLSKTCRPSISYFGGAIPFWSVPGLGRGTPVWVVGGNSERHSVLGLTCDTAISGTAPPVWECFLSRRSARYSPNKPAIIVPAKNDPTEPPITAPLPTGQLAALLVQVPADVLVVPVMLDWDCCWLERPKDVRLKAKDPPVLLPQHVVNDWSLQHQLDMGAL
jgi:hypothetical protein